MIFSLILVTYVTYLLFFVSSYIISISYFIIRVYDSQLTEFFVLYIFTASLGIIKCRAACGLQFKACLFRLSLR